MILPSEIDFSDLAWIQIPVKVGDKSYILKEADEEASRTFKNAQTSCLRMNEQGKVIGIEGAANLPSLLVSLCLYEENGKRVPRETVLKFPHQVVNHLFEVAKQISKLEEDESLEALKKKREVIDEQIKAVENREETLGKL